MSRSGVGNYRVIQIIIGYMDSNSAAAIISLERIENGLFTTPWSGSSSWMFPVSNKIRAVPAVTLFLDFV